MSRGWATPSVPERPIQQLKPVAKPTQPRPKPTPAKPSTPKPEQAQPVAQEATPVVATRSETTDNTVGSAFQAGTAGPTPRTSAGLSSSPSPAGAPGIVDAAHLQVTKKVTAEYPAISRKRKDQGTVILLIQITGGRVTSVRVERSSGHTPLDEAAVKAVKQWVFDISGYGDAVTARIPFTFKLK